MWSSNLQRGTIQLVMPKCKKCDVKIPATSIIDGKRRNLCRRRLCLTCSPFKSAGKYLPLDHPSRRPIRACRECGVNFHYNRKNGGKGDRCGSCISGAARDRAKIRCIEYLGAKCVKCGYCKCPDALEFHHRDPSMKRFSLSGAYLRRWEALTAEMDKCDLLCANCHRELEYQLRRHGFTDEQPSFGKWIAGGTAP